ncbi:hypothetical protein F511_28629 [Dorcoceras hygrometricum]|uniref:Uncharacterized protein n=1 Tax=Dorcoceras hygrometricum TaxID=472368 RepID=A0A2Z7BNE2_9LAMI|nr:hypothetical protein F511_28629 [Dorcoceras hygrometricum]
MASSFYRNSQHIYFDSVLTMDDQGMVSMFQALMASGLAGFLGCPAVICEAALVDFFENASVREGVYQYSGWAVGSKQAKGFAVQISLLLENISNLELGESSEFPASKILTENTVHRFVSLNDKVSAEEAAGTPKPKAASKKRQVVAAVGAPVIKKKRTMRKKPTSSKDNLEIVAVAQEAMPIQMFEPITDAPVAEDISDQPAGETDGVKEFAADVDATAEKIDEQVAEPSANVETSVGESFEPAVEVPAEEARPSSADDVDFIIQQVIEDTALVGPAEEIQEVAASADRDQPAATTEERHWFNLPYEDLMARFDAERQVVTASDTDEDIEQVDVFTAEDLEAERPGFGTDVGNVQLQSVDDDQQVQFSVEEPSADEAMSLEDILLSITLDISLPSAGMEHPLAHGLKWTRTCCSKIVEGRSRDHGAIIARTNTNTKSTCWLRTMIRVDGMWVVEPFYDQWVKIPRPVVCTEVSKQRCFVDFFPTLLDEQSSSSYSSDESMNFDDTPTSISLPATASTTPDVTEALNQLRASIDQICERDDGAKHRDTLLLHLHNFERQVIARLDAQDRVLGPLRRDSNDQRNLLSLELQSSHKQLGNQLVTTGLDVVDVRRVVRESHQELNARINTLDEQVADTRHELLEFSSQAQQTLNIITSQLSELVAYINRGGDN